MKYSYPVLTGLQSDSLALVAARLRNDDLAKKLMTAYGERRELVLARHSLAFRTERGGNWALAFWGQNTPRLFASMRAAYGSVPSVEVIPGDAFMSAWGFTSQAKGEFRIVYRAKRGSGARSIVGRIRVRVDASPDGSFERRVSCTPYTEASVKVRGVLDEAEREGSIVQPGGCYLAVTRRLLDLQLQHHALHALGVTRVKDRVHHFALKEFRG